MGDRGSLDLKAYECFETIRLAGDPALLKRFVFLLGAEHVVPEPRDCHLYALLRARPWCRTPLAAARKHSACHIGKTRLNTYAFIT